MNINKFVQKIIFQTPQKFDTLTAKEVCTFPNYHISDAVCSEEAKYSKAAKTCSILAMDNGKDIFIGHFAPELEYKTANFLDKLEYIVKQFKDATGNLNAVMTGAYDYRIGTKQADESYTLCANIAKIIDDNTQIFSMICGKKNPMYTENLGLTRDGFFISHNRDLGITTDFLSRNDSLTEVDRKLADCYSIYEIAPEHKIFFEG